MAEEVDENTRIDFQKMCANAGCSCSTIQRSETTEATDENLKERKKRGACVVCLSSDTFLSSLISIPIDTVHTIEVE